MQPLFKDRGTEYEAMVEWRIEGEILRKEDETYSSVTSLTMNLILSYPWLNAGLHNKNK
jgi:hypothetical protein